MHTLFAQTNNFNVKVNFQDQATVPPVDYVADFGQAYQLKSDGLSYGWLSMATQSPIDLTTPGTGVGRNRNVGGVSLIQNTLIHMQGDDIQGWTGNRATEAYWEIEVPNGFYDVSVSVGDPVVEGNPNNLSVHHINVEGVVAINDFIVNNSLPAGDPSRFQAATVTVEVSDGRLTIDPLSSQSKNTKINSVEVLSVNPSGNEVLEFSDPSLAVELYENADPVNKSNFISATNFVPSPVDVNLTADSGGSTPGWIKVGGQLLDGTVIHNTAEAEIVFEFDPTGLSAGVYQATVTASGPNQTTTSFTAELTVSPPLPLTFPVQINFQDAQTTTPAGWETDFGDAYGVKPNGYTYGWLSIDGSKTPLSLVGNGRNRNVTGFTVLQNTLMHMQYDDVGGSGINEEGMWEIEIPNGDYRVTVVAGDLASENLSGTQHHINVEGKNVLSYQAAIGQSNLETRVDIVKVNDGKLSLDATGGFNTKLVSLTIEESENSTQPQVLGTSIPDGAMDVDLLPTISSLNLYLPNSGIDPVALNNTNVKLYEVTEDPEIQGGEILTNVVSTIGTSGGFDVISLTPNTKLKTNTRYKFEVSENLLDQSGVAFLPYSSYFTTGNGASSYNGPIEFVGRTTVATGGNGYTSLVIGPDEKLYGITSDGYIKRWDIDRSTGLLENEELITTLRDAEGGNRLAVGMTFDPNATAQDLQVWVSHTKYGFSDQPNFQGKISKLEGSNLETITDYVIHLPRSKKDHVTNSIEFGPDGALYILQGSLSAMGALENAWNRHETLLSASLLRLDVAQISSQSISLPIDAQTEEGGTFNPYATNAPLTIYANGIRNAYDMDWHSNGQLYVPTNGSAGLANAPGSDPASTDYREPQYQAYGGPLVPYVSGITTQNDYLFRVEEGGYYGHPNPRRAEYVLNGGNPGTSTPWPDAVVSQYPEGTQVDANYRGYSANLGKNKSPNGIIEYQSDAFNGALAGKLINVWYTPGILVVMEPGAGPDHEIENIIEDIPSLNAFNKPLDVIEDVVTGNLYVSEYQDIQGGMGKITLIKPSIPPSNVVNPITDIQINFQDEASESPEDWLKDFGEDYALRNLPSQGGGQLSYGWLRTDMSTPLDLSDPGNGRARTSASDPLLNTFMHMQGDDISNWNDGTPEEGVWGVAVNNGFYEVTVSVGDADETGSTHHINAEGVNVIDRFQPSGANGSASRFSTATAAIHVTDGVLNLDAMEGGFNTKINSVSVVPLDSVFAPPALEVNLAGDNFQQTYLNSVEVSFSSTPNASGASQVNLSYTLFDQSGSPLQSGNNSNAFTIDQVGAYTLVVTGTDDSPNQNQTKVVRQFSVEAASGALISLENMTKIPDTNIGFPADSIYSFHHIRDPTNSNGVAVRLHNTNVMRIHNPGVSPLQINAMTITDETEFVINTIGGTAAENVGFPVSIPADGFLDVEMQFIENGGGKGDRAQQLIIHSNADNGSSYTVQLLGNYMGLPESGNESNSIQLFRALGFKTSMNGDPRPSSAPPLPEDVNSGVHGDLISASVFEQADPNQPVRAFQLAAFRGPGNANTRLIEVNSDTPIVDEAGNQFSYTYGPLWHQSLFPKTNNNTSNKKIAGDFSNRITQPFRIQVALYRSSGGNPSGNLVDQVSGIRIYKVLNYAGEVVPNHYIVIQDYVNDGCEGGSANCDWNDNLQYFINIKPVNDPFVAFALSDVMVTGGDDVVYNASTAFDQGYPGNEFTYSAQLTSGNPLPSWLSIDENTGEVRGTVPLEATGAINIQVTATDLNGIVVTDADLTSFRININEAVIKQDIWLEAECGVIGANWNVVNLPEASAGTYVTINTGLNSYGSAPGSSADHISHTFTVNEAGNYQLYARVRATNYSNDSFWVRLDGGNWVQWSVSPLAGNFDWREVGVLSLDFAAGSTHTLDFAYREDGADLDKLHLTANGISPTGLGDPAGNCSSGGNQAPLADAGEDVMVVDSDDNGTESVVLDGSGSSDDGTIVSYSWSDGSTVVGTEANITVDAPVGTTLYTLTVTDNEGVEATDAVEVTVNTASSEIWLEAECGVIGANWNVVNLPEASAGTYVTINTGLNSYGSAPGSSADHISHTFTVNEAGNYQLYARVRATNYSNDSFWVRLDGGNWVQWSVSPLAGNFDWREVGVLSLDFAAGSTHTLDFAYREDGADLDKLHLTANGISPTGLGDPAGNCSSGGNQAPLADAGEDVMVVDSDDNGTESVVLDGSGSSDDGTIVSYSWSDGSTVVGTEANITVDAPVGTTLYTLTVTDNEGVEATDAVEVTVNTASSEIWLEAECGVIGANWNVVNLPEASAGTYVTINTGLNSYGSAPGSSADHVSHTFTVNEAGSYQLYARVRALSGNDDSFWVRLDGGSWVQWNVTPRSGNFDWREVGVLSLDFAAGSTHTLDFAYREDGADLDKLHLTANGISPTGLGDPAVDCGNSLRTAQSDKNLNGASLISSDGTCNNCIEILAYPNPTQNGEVTIKLMNMDLYESLEVRVINTKGQILRHEFIDDTKVISQMTLSLGGYGSGIYLVQVIAKDQIYQKEIIKL
ncbi:PKD domain-containing protein [Catalinimonas alkaloidigena]|uniref:PKD domain-containing protein n=1 Tax=Catalinimonas alkaloidigena TaxID=1075417 RepID=UPI00240654D9|nr:putative Ig domain-containing protein [Catalinimonas alkaloidigena]